MFSLLSHEHVIEQNCLGNSCSATLTKSRNRVGADGPGANNRLCRPFDVARAELQTVIAQNVESFDIAKAVDRKAARDSVLPGPPAENFAMNLLA